MKVISEWHGVVPNLAGSSSDLSSGPCSNSASVTCIICGPVFYFVLDFFSSQLDWGKNNVWRCVILRCTTWWPDAHIHCEMTSVVRWVNISITSQNYHSFLCVWWTLERSTLTRRAGRWQHPGGGLEISSLWSWRLGQQGGPWFPLGGSALGAAGFQRVRVGGGGIYSPSSFQAYNTVTLHMAPMLCIWSPELNYVL